MSDRPTVEIEPGDIVRYLIYQQFYYGEDRIHGRTKDRSEYIEGAGNAIEAFYDLITTPISLIDEGKIEQYLDFFNKDIHKILVMDILERYKEFKETLGDETNREVVLTVVVGQGLEAVQTACFKNSIEELNEYMIKKKTLNSNQRDEIKKVIISLYGRSNPNIGMIYSLGFMKFISKKIKEKNIEAKCNQLLNKHYELILETIENKGLFKFTPQ